ncbi:MAG TPA: RNA 2',3'-cyclic phosphodiesterase [Solirubrobacterales bacterium]|jgi:2'-5' RNA ligase|nr:RNA 2',3'-cyclic phosphodiesterase [Solirubrobacterales bacterium]
MPKEKPKSQRSRLFVALDLPEAVRDRIAGWSGDELSDPALRPVPRESLHITLAFLGYMPERDIGCLEKVVEGIEAPAPLVRLEDPVAKPSPRRPRLFALPADSPDTVVLQKILEERLVVERLYKPEKRPFWPHVTVARVKSGGRRPEGSGTVARQPGKLPAELLSPVLGVRLTLYRSELQPRGARYTSLAQVELSEDGRQ